jgi:hypothetical protein
MSGGQQRKRIGEFMMEKGLILREWIAPILEYSKVNGVRFGEAAVALGYVTDKELREILVQPYKKQVFFHLDPAFFPQSSREMIPVAAIIQYGVLPLGFKNETHWFRTRRRLNLGVLNPQDTVAIETVKRQHLETVKAFKTFQVLPEEFLQTLELCYGVERSTLLDLGPEQICQNLMLYLQLERRKRSRPAQPATK